MPYIPGDAKRARDAAAARARYQRAKAAAAERAQSAASALPSAQSAASAPPSKRQRTFPEDDAHLDGDAVFGVRGGLVLPFVRTKERSDLPAHLAARETLPMPVWTARLDLTLAPA